MDEYADWHLLTVAPAKRLEKSAPVWLHLRETPEILVSIPFTMGRHELLHRDQDREGVGIGICSHPHQGGQRLLLSERRLLWRLAACRIS